MKNRTFEDFDFTDFWDDDEYAKKQTSSICFLYLFHFFTSTLKNREKMGRCKYLTSMLHQGRTRGRILCKNKYTQSYQ